MKPLANPQTGKDQKRHAGPRPEGKKPTALETNYRAIFNTVNDAIFIHDPETGTIQDVNDKMCEMYGYLPEEMRRLNIESVSAGYPPYTQTEALRWVRRATRGEPSFSNGLPDTKTARSFGSRST